MANKRLPSPILPRPPFNLPAVVDWSKQTVAALYQYLQQITQQLNEAAPIIGTWQPGISADSAAGTATYSARDGRWTLIDDDVTIWGDVRATTWSGSPNGNLRVHGLPFISATSLPHSALVAIFHEGVNWSAGYTQIVGNIQGNSQNVRFYEVGDNVSSQLVQASAVTPPVRIQIFGTYRRQFDAPVP